MKVKYLLWFEIIWLIFIVCFIAFMSNTTADDNLFLGMIFFGFYPYIILTNIALLIYRLILKKKEISTFELGIFVINIIFIILITWFGYGVFFQNSLQIKMMGDAKQYIDSLTDLV